MTHGRVVIEGGNEYEVLDAGGRDGPTRVLKLKCTHPGQRHEVGTTPTLDALELDTHPEVQVFDHKDDETTAEKLANRLLADKDLA